MKQMGKLMEKCMTPADLDGVSIDDMGLNCSDSTAPTFNPDKATVSYWGQLSEMWPVQSQYLYVAYAQKK